jgi:putative drug exporter of the RND superfamily
MPILMFCVAFGLSMDYEVFLLSRIKEEHDAGADTETSVAVGLQRSGRIVTAAAVLIAVVFLSFVTGRVSFIQLFGLGLTLAVLMDAFVVRGTLVPAFMRLAGEWNWWAPRPLRRFHDRWGISESVDLDDVAPADIAPVDAVAPVDDVDDVDAVDDVDDVDDVIVARHVAVRVPAAPDAEAAGGPAQQDDAGQASGDTLSPR